MKQPKKQPLRMCVGCGEMKEKKQLVRIVRNKDGQVFLDATGRAAGRGAYLCQSAVCLQKAVKARRLDRAFGTKVDTDVYALLEKELAEQ